jgi:prepilin-type N-terminal cleavage/methylation domain-containing protein
MRNRERGGFTILEVLVALAVSAVVLVGARGVIEALATHARAIGHEAGTADALANADGILRQLLADLVVRGDTVPSITGDDKSLTFRSDCDTADGWREPCTVQIRVERHDGVLRATLQTANDSPILLRDSVSSAWVRYLVSAEVGGFWTDRWENTVLLPRAIAIVMDGDTLVAAVGDRR